MEPAAPIGAGRKKEKTHHFSNVRGYCWRGFRGYLRVFGGDSLNSLSVRVPHNFSCLVLQLQTPNPWLEFFRGRFIDSQFFWPSFMDSKKNHWENTLFFHFFNFSLHLSNDYCETTVFYFKESLLVKTVFFQQFRLPDL